MRYSTRVTYGLNALLHLANAHGERAVPASQIAREEGISAPYLEQILHRLKKKQWIRSLRGSSGGYVLSKSPGEITVGAVLKDLQGSRRAPAARAQSPRPAKVNTAALASRLFWEKLDGVYSRFLESQSLKELIDEARRLQKRGARSDRVHFSI